MRSVPSTADEALALLRGWRPVSSWAGTSIRAAVPRRAHALVVGPEHERSALGSVGRSVTGADPEVATTALEEGRGDTDVVVLADALSWVPDERVLLRQIGERLSGEMSLVAAVPNAAWLPARVALLHGRSPFGTGPVVSRPLRFFTRTTLEAAFGELGVVAEITTVDRDVGEALRAAARGDASDDRAVVDLAARAPDAATVGFVVRWPAPATRSVVHRMAGWARRQRAGS